MSTFNTNMTDAELRDLLKTALMEGGENDSLTETFIEMEKAFVFGTTATIAFPIGKEQELFSQLTNASAYKVAGKLGLKWLFTGLGATAIATGMIVYNQQQPETPPKAITALNTQKDTAVSQPNELILTDSLVQNPTIFTPLVVAKQTYELEQLSPAFSDPSVQLERSTREQETEASGIFKDSTNRFSRKANRRVNRSLRGLSNLIELAELPEMPEFPEMPELPEPAIEPLEPIDLGFIELDQRDQDSLSNIDTLFNNVKRIELDIEMGDIHLLPATGDQVRMHGFIHEIESKQSGSVLKIYAQKPEKRKHRACNNCEESMIHLEIPTGTTFIIVTSNGSITADNLSSSSGTLIANFGDINVSNCQVDLTATTTSGELQLINLTGSINATAEFGDLNLEHITGSVTAKANSGNINAQTIIGDALIESDFGDISVENLQGKLTLVSNSGMINLDSITGSHCIIQSSFGDVDITNIHAITTIEANSGNVHVNELTGDLVIDSDFGNVIIAGYWGKLLVNANSGNIVLNDINGDMHVSSQFGNLDINQSNGNAFFDVQSGNIDIKNMLLRDSLTVHVDFGNSKINLKNNIDELAFDIEATMGKAKINKGDMKLEKENGLIHTEKGRILVKGTANSGNISFN